MVYDYEGKLLDSSIMALSRRMIMKMVTIVCREKLEGELLGLFNAQGIKGYTVMSGLGGRGATRAVSEHSWTDKNMMFMVALDDHQLAPLATAVKRLYSKLHDEHLGQEVPLKVFLQPCEVIL
jgi:hypothetical protein